MIKFDCRKIDEMEEKHEHPEDTESLKEIRARYGNSFSDLNTSSRKSEFHEILLAIRDISLSLITRIQKIPKEKIKITAIIVLVLVVCLSSFLFLGKVIFPWIATVSELTSKPNLVSDLPTETLIADTKPPTVLPSLSPKIYVTLTPSPTIIPIVTQPISIEGCVKVSQLRVREGPGIDTGLLGGILFGDCYEFFLKSEQGDGTWLGFKFTNSTGWVKAEYIGYEGDLEALQEFDD